MGTVTIGGTTYNIYGTSAAADAYLAARVVGSEAAAWEDLDADDRSKALVSGTRYLDRQNWNGQRTVLAQDLEFPRTGLTDKDGNAVDDATVPLLMEEANYELALALNADATILDKGSTASNTKSVKAGSASVSFFRATDGAKLPSVAFELVGLFLGGSDTSNTGPLATGTDGESAFGDIDQWGRTRGFP